jgi:hypothetical protein
MAGYMVAARYSYPYITALFPPRTLFPMTLRLLLMFALPLFQ